MCSNLSHCRTVYCLSNWSYNENKTINWENLTNFVAVAIVLATVVVVVQIRVITKTINQENLMNFVAVAIVSAVVLGHLFNKRVVF